MFYVVNNFGRRFCFDKHFGSNRNSSNFIDSVHGDCHLYSVGRRCCSCVDTYCCRVVLNDHTSEMTQLKSTDRERLMRVVFATEATLREMMSPVKINLASLGNMVPHLHWHVIPRFSDDRHFPASIWAEPRRPAAETAGKPDLAALAACLSKTIG